MKNRLLLAAGCSLALLAPNFAALAQDAPPPAGQPGQPDGRRGRGFNPEEMLQRVKAAMKATDEEWSVLKPMIEKVGEKVRDNMGSRFGGRGGAPSPDRPVRPGQAEAQALRETVEKDGASNEEIAAKLTAVREQRKKSQAELEAAREDLKKVVTPRQEAVLVSMGLLD